MHILLTIAKKELLITFRRKGFQVMGLIFFLLVAVSGYTAYERYLQKKGEQERAMQLSREQWEHQDPKHPHVAAHFGHFAVVPVSALSLFDTGLQSFLATVIYLEPHKQNEGSFIPAEELPASQRFGELTFAQLLQVLFPLFILFHTYAAFSGERESHTLSLLYAQGLTFRTLFWGKWLGHACWILLCTLPVFLVLGLLQVGLGFHPDLLIRVGLLYGIYLCYYLLLAATCLLLSAFCRRSKDALLLLLGAWVFLTVLFPRWASAAADRRHPLPSKYEFMNSVQYDLQHGIDGHDPHRKQAHQLEKQLLDKYGVTRPEDLPFNLEGYLMQEGETYTTRVYQKHFADLQHRLLAQLRYSTWCSVLDPFLVLKNTSMALCESDYTSQLRFQQQAEQYRQQFVRQMNELMEYGSKYGDWSFRLQQEQYRKVPRFQYHPADWKTALSPYLPGGIALLVWAALLFFLLRYYEIKKAYWT